MPIANDQKTFFLAAPRKTSQQKIDGSFSIYCAPFLLLSVCDVDH